MTKSTAQLDAEIALALREGTNNHHLTTPRQHSFRALIARAESAIDAHPELTRGGRGIEEAELTFRSGR